MAAGMLLSTLGSLYNGILTGARVPYAMARDGRFFAALGSVSPHTRVPVRALAAQCGWVCVLVLSGSFDALTDYAMFAAWIFYGLAASSVFVFRRRLPDGTRPFRAPGYPVVPALFLLVTCLLLVNTVVTSPVGSLVGLGLIALGVPLYWRFRRGLARRSREGRTGVPCARSVASRESGERRTGRRSPSGPRKLRCSPTAGS